MDYSKYANSLEYPKSPTKPVTPKSTLPEAFRTHATELEEYAMRLEVYQAAKSAWQSNEVDRWENFRLDALEEVGLTGHPLSDRAYSYAYEQGHYAGMTEVYSKLTRMAEIILGDCLQPPINPMRERLLLRIREIKKEQNGFPKDTMRWKLISFGKADGYPDVNTHISNVNFDLLNDTELLEVYELIIRRVYVQM